MKEMVDLSKKNPEAEDICEDFHVCIKWLFTMQKSGDVQSSADVLDEFYTTYEKMAKVAATTSEKIEEVSKYFTKTIPAKCKEYFEKYNNNTTNTTLNKMSRRWIKNKCKT